MTIDLRLPHMRDGKPGYDKIKQSLAKLGEMDMMFAFMNEFGKLQEGRKVAYAYDLHRLS